MVDQRRNQRFETLLSGEVYQAAWRYACHLSSSREAAEDLLQDALLAALARLAALRDETRFKPWLLSIVRHRFIDLTRRQRVRPDETAESPELASADEPQAIPTLLAEALGQLHPAYRELLVLAYLEDLDTSEIGHVLGISARQATKRLSRARVALRRVLIEAGQMAPAAKAKTSVEQGS